MDNNNEGIFRDFIPEGEDTGALTGNGYQDFVPSPEPVAEQPVEEAPVQPEPVQEVAQEPVVEQPQVAPLEPVEVVEGSVE